MNYQTFKPTSDLEAIVKCHWTLEVPAEMADEKQRIIPDGCIEMAFILGDDIKRFTSDDEFVLQPRAMVMGQITKPSFIQPTGYVNTFAVRFYPYGFANFTKTAVKELADKDTPAALIFGEKPANDLQQKIIHAAGTEERIKIVENFLLSKLTEKSTIDQIVKSTIDSLFMTKGSVAINSILKDDLSRRRSLERKFIKQVGISPKQLGKIVRLQTALKMMLLRQSDSLTKIAYESDYYDQAHFIKDFKEFTGISPKDYLKDDKMILSSLFYSKD
ncbi:MAG: helix-turn-helix domain-containing protein [Cyclobacteriaceae bacterium]